MLPPKKRIAERQSRADPVFLKQRQHLAHIDVRRLDASAAPKAARRRTVDRTDAAPFVKILPMFEKKRQKHAV